MNLDFDQILASIMNELDLDTLIQDLQNIRQKHGNLPVCHEVHHEGGGADYNNYINTDIGFAQPILDTYYGYTRYVMSYNSSVSENKTIKCLVLRR